MDKKNVFRFFGHTALLSSVLALLAASYMGLAYWRDPLCLFRPAESGKFYYAGHMHILNAGIINSFEFDSAIVSTSVMENSSCAGMEKALGGRFMNLSISGSHFAERSVVLSYLLKKKNMKRVVYSLDRYYQHCPIKGYPERFWTFLYDDDRWNDLKVYTDGRYLRCVFFGVPDAPGKSLDRPKAWFDKAYYTCRFKGLQSWIDNREKRGTSDFLKNVLPNTAAKADPSRPLTHDGEREARSEEYVEKYVLSYAKAYPDTEFLLVFPPYWRFDYASMRQTNPSSFALHQSVIRYVVKRAAELSNVKVYGFEDCSFVDDIVNYRDITHYSEEINQYLATSLGAGEHRLTPDNVEAYLERCEELARNFDIKGLNEQVKKMLAEKN